MLDGGGGGAATIYFLNCDKFQDKRQSGWKVWMTRLGNLIARKVFSRIKVKVVWERKKQNHHLKVSVATVECANGHPPTAGVNDAQNSVGQQNDMKKTKEWKARKGEQAKKT